MNDIIVVLASATTATRMKKQLLAAGHRAKVIQTPKTLSVNGCTYAIQTGIESVEETQKIAVKLNVRIKGFYRLENNQYVPVY